MFKIFTMTALTLATLTFGAASASACGPYGQQLSPEQLRVQRIQKRIDAGAQDGSLTHFELKRLNRMARKAEQKLSRFSADGYIDQFESRRITRLLNRTSNAIYTLRHNNQTAHMHRRNFKRERREQRQTNSIRLSGWNR